MKHILSAFVALAAALTLGACQEEPFDPVDPGTETSAPDIPGEDGFTLVATYGDPASKAVFGENGLSMVWTPGDVLYMIDPAKVNPTVELTTDIANPAATASFHTDAIVPTGDYIVVFGQSSLQVEKDVQIQASLTDLNDQIRLYGNVSVTRGQTTASITLNQLYTLLTFNFANVPSGFSDKLSLGMAVVSGGLKNLGSGVITASGLQTEYSGTFVTSLGQIDGDTGCTFVAPVDLRNNRVIFFASGIDGDSELDSNLYVYEVNKAGIELQAGKRYTINIDFAAGNTKYVALMQGDSGLDLTSADDFLAAALAQWTGRVSLQKDVNFSGEAFLPLKAGFLKGNGHKLSYIQCGLNYCDNVGVLSGGSVDGLTVENAIFEGANLVGALAGTGYCWYCSCIDVKVNGESQVGGLVGSGTSIIRNSSLLGTSIVNGKDGVGGIAGTSSKSIQNCVAKGNITVSGDSREAYIGGISGEAGGGAMECGFEGSVTGGNYLGGVVGRGRCTKCYCVGDLYGVDYVGGVSGNGDCYGCYHIGNIYGGMAVGGISGSTDEVDVNNCYSCGNITGNSSQSCYGICAANLDAYVSTNLSSYSNMYASGTPQGLANCTDFLAQLYVINDHEYYYDICWPDRPDTDWPGNSHNCPILKWQYEGFGGDISIPSFVPVEW